MNSTYRLSPTVAGSFGESKTSLGTLQYRSRVTPTQDRLLTLSQQLESTKQVQQRSPQRKFSIETEIEKLVQSVDSTTRDATSQMDDITTRINQLAHAFQQEEGTFSHKLLITLLFFYV